MTQSIKGMQAYIGHGKKEKRQDNDFYATPDNAITALLQREKFEGDIWIGTRKQGKYPSSYGSVLF